MLKLEIASLENKWINDASFTNRSQLISNNMNYAWNWNDERRHSLSRLNSWKDNLSYIQNKENNYSHIVEHRRLDSKLDQSNDNSVVINNKSHHAHQATFGQAQFDEMSIDSFKKNWEPTDLNSQRTPFKPLIVNYADLDQIVQKYSKSIQRNEFGNYFENSKLNTIFIKCVLSNYKNN